METGDSILDAIDEELSFEDGDDVEMMDIEEGEVVEGMVSVQTSEGNENEVNIKPPAGNPQRTESMNKNKKKKKKKNRNKNKKKNGIGGSNGVDIDRFVLGVCRHLRERKSYLVYTAVGVLGISALSDLVREVDAVQACGGQKTADGVRFRSAGGILWNILKARDPNAYREIMKKGKEFEKQFRRPSVGQALSAKINNSSQVASAIISGKTSASTSDDDAEIKVASGQEQPGLSVTGDGDNQRSIHSKVRMPVSYDGLLDEEAPKGQSTSA
ncbi:hypothetical protein Cgig2_027903 [Carnegiea gigantea]|uniref:Phosphorylated adapter RNA export protein n=1 Tax=Carnegiea gigantea TaxID=171969 RepID=A0A9Q1KM64_9CARY|nr:hypothetical protein Cgig2_027903 [Carnegiea gigantea]